MQFRKSSYSANESHCVEVATLTNGAAIRDTKNKDQGHLEAPQIEWTGFLQAVKGTSA